MRYLVLGLALALMAAPAAAETRALTGFTAISASEGVIVEITQGPDYSVVVSGPQADQIATSVSNNRLHISRKGFLNFGDGPDAHVQVTLPRLEALNASAGVQVTARDLVGQRLAIQVSQGAVVEVTHVRIGGLSLSASQGAQLSIDGACTNLTARASMGGMVEADGLECANAIANASMGGMLEIHARESIEASASMGGVVEVSGNPGDRQTSGSMGGQVDLN